MDNLPKYNVPWELISTSLTGTLTVEEELQLKQWLLSDEANNDKYFQIQELWKKGLKDYTAYKEADENKAWKALNLKMADAKIETSIIEGQFASKSKFLRNWIAVAAVFLGLVALGLWFVMSDNNKPIVYETAANVEKRVELNDGTTISLKPLTRIEVSRKFNKKNRIVKMVSGEAFFEVAHLVDKPFVVMLGKTQIKDIGTSFTIRKGNKEISVAVTSGKVEFTKTGTLETRELSAGTNVIYNLESESFGDIHSIKSSDEIGELMNFDNTPLSDAIVSIQKFYDKKIILADEYISNKKLTAQLSGMPYETVLNVICKSLGLEYSVRDSVYILKERK